MEQQQPVTAWNEFPASRVGWTAVAVLFLFTVLSVLDRNLLTLLVGPIKADLGLSDVQLSLLYGLAFAIFYAVMGLPSGWMIDRFQRRVVIFWGVVVWSFATLMTDFAQSYSTLFGAHAVVGAGEAVLVPGLVSSGMTLASAISAMLIYRLISWIFIAVLGWVVFFFMFRTEMDIDPDANGQEDP